MMLDAVLCPRCDRLMEPRCGESVTATSYASCLRQCEVCGVAVSNSSTNPRTIYSAPESAVPNEVHEHLERTLSLSLNDVNRTNKRSKFCFETSEDALTWTVFRGLQREGTLLETLARAGVIKPSVNPAATSMLLWGAPVPSDDLRAQEVRTRLIQISDRLGEDERRRTEPDVTIDRGHDGVVFIEVKHRSANDRVARVGNETKWSRYVDGCSAFADGERVKDSQMYELARNWRLASELASGRPFTLVNLGPATLFSDDGLRAFRSSLSTTCQGSFVELTWDDLLNASQLVPSHYIARFVRDRRGSLKEPQPA